MMIPKIGDTVRYKYKSAAAGDSDVSYGIAEAVDRKSKTVTIDDLYRQRKFKLQLMDGGVHISKPLCLIPFLGSNKSGKTTTLTALRWYLENVRAGNGELTVRPPISRHARYWDEQQRRVFFEKRPPKFTGEHPDKGIRLAESAEEAGQVLPPPLHIEVGFAGSNIETSFLLPDIGGEQFNDEKHRFFKRCVERGHGFALLVDPFKSDRYCAWRRSNGLELPKYSEMFEICTPVQILQNLLNVCDQSKKKLSATPLAVVLTKVDERGLVDLQKLEPQGVGDEYDPGLTAEVSSITKRCIEKALGWGNLTGLVKQHFPRHAYFAVSPVGSSTRVVTDEEVASGHYEEGEEVFIGKELMPQRIDEFLLWLKYEGIPRRGWWPF